MTGPYLLILVIILVLVIAFLITLLVLNDGTRKIISANAKLVENQNTLIEQHKNDETELKNRISELEEELRFQTGDKVTQLREQMRQYRENIELTADMGDEDLMTWLDQKMDETRLYTDTELTLKTMANSLGLTQRRLGALFKNSLKYTSLGDYLNEKRFLLSCRLLREKPNWTIEAIGGEAGFGSRRTFQMEMKRRLGITPLQYQQGMESAPDAAPMHKSQ
jgi:AraC-like DNA-binding protein